MVPAMNFVVTIAETTFTGTLSAVRAWAAAQPATPGFTVKVELAPETPRIPKLNTCACVAKAWPHLAFITGAPNHGQPDNRFFSEGMSFNGAALENFIIRQFADARYAPVLSYTAGTFTFSVQVPSRPEVVEAVTRRVVGFMAGVIKHRQRMNSARPLRWATFDTLCKVGRLTPLAVTEPDEPADEEADDEAAD
jgi:hypothetical protein